MSKKALLVYEGIDRYPTFNEGFGDAEEIAQFEEAKRKHFNGSMEGRDIENLVRSLSAILEDAYETNPNKESITFADFQAAILGFNCNNLYEWARAAINQGFEVSATHVNKLEDVKERPDYLNLCMVHGNPFSEKGLEDKLAEGTMVLGDDDLIGKVNFSIMPYLFKEYFSRREANGLVLKKLPVIRRFAKDNKKDSLEGMFLDELHRESVEDFVRDNNYGDFLETFPTFVSLPSRAKIEDRHVRDIYTFFKRKGKNKVIVKGNISAASGHNLNPYLILDLGLSLGQNESSKIAEWQNQINRYQDRHGPGSAIMIQEMIDTEKEAENSETISTIARKHNVVGHSVWSKGIKYVYNLLKEKFEDHRPVDIGIVDKNSSGVIVNTDIETSNYSSDQLNKVGRFLNLISPFGCHALDFLLDSTSGREYVLEANPSRVRGDQIGSNFFGGSNMFEGYTTWVSDLLEGREEATGEYTARILSMDKEEKRKFLNSVRNTWGFVEKFIGNSIVYCDENGIEEDTEFSEREFTDPNLEMFSSLLKKDYLQRFKKPIIDSYYDLNIKNDSSIFKKSNIYSIINDKKPYYYSSIIDRLDKSFN